MAREILFSSAVHTQSLGLGTIKGKLRCFYTRYISDSGGFNVIKCVLFHSLMTYDTQYNEREIEYIEHNYSSDASSL